MSSEFDSDLQELRHELSASRAEFLGALQSLDNSDLDRARRGGGAELDNDNSRRVIS